MPALAAVEGGVVVGGAELSLPLDDDIHTMSVELGVAPRHRGHGVGRALTVRVGELAEQERRDLFQAELLVPAGVHWGDWPGGRFARRYRLRIVSSEDRFLLDLPVDDERLRDLEASLPVVEDAEDGEIADRIVSRLGPCPDEYLSEWARMQTQMNQDVPMGELTRTAGQVDVARIRESDTRMAAMGWTKIRSMALGPRDAGIGYTEMFVSAHDPDFVVQDDTLVDRAHRGRRLGTRLPEGGCPPRVRGTFSRQPGLTEHARDNI